MYEINSLRSSFNSKIELAKATPNIFIKQEVLDKIQYWVNKATGEVSGLGTIKVEDNNIIVTEAILLPQKNSGSATDIEAEDVCKAMYRMREAEGSLRYWWHSHANMQVFWSGQDRETINLISQGGWCVCTVFNKRKESLTLYSQTTPISIVTDNLNLQTLNATIQPNEIWDKEFDENIKETTIDFAKFTRSDGDWEDMYRAYLQMSGDEDAFFGNEPESKLGELNKRSQFLTNDYEETNYGILNRKMDLVPVKRKQNIPWIK